MGGRPATGGCQGDLSAGEWLLIPAGRASPATTTHAPRGSCWTRGGAQSGVAWSTRSTRPPGRSRRRASLACSPSGSTGDNETSHHHNRALLPAAGRPRAAAPTRRRASRSRRLGAELNKRLNEVQRRIDSGGGACADIHNDTLPASSDHQRSPQNVDPEVAGPAERLPPALSAERGAAATSRRARRPSPDPLPTEPNPIRCRRRPRRSPRRPRRNPDGDRGGAGRAVPPGGRPGEVERAGPPGAGGRRMSPPQ